MIHGTSNLLFMLQILRLRAKLLSPVIERCSPIELDRKHGTSEKQRCIAFHHSPDLTVKQLCLHPSFSFLHTLSPHDTIFTKHQALAPSSPMLLFPKSRYVRVEFCSRASARAWRETKDLRNTMKHTAHIVNCKKYAKFVCSSSHSHLKMLVPGSKNT